MPYTEQIAGYSHVVDQLGRVTGTRKFVVTAAGDAALPVIGTATLPHPVTGVGIAGCKARRIRAVRDASDPEPQFVVEYDTEEPTLASGSIGIPTDTSARSEDARVEMISVDADENFEFVVQGLPVPPGQKLFKRAVMEGFTIPRPGLTEAARNTLLATMRASAGTINNAAFQGYAEGQVYFDGWRGGTYRDENGVLKWSYELMFIARLLTGELDYADAPITKDDWLYVWNPAGNSGFDIPQTIVGGERIYRKTDFSGLLT